MVGIDHLFDCSSALDAIDTAYRKVAVGTCGVILVICLHIPSSVMRPLIVSFRPSRDCYGLEARGTRLARREIEHAARRFLVAGDQRVFRQDLPAVAVAGLGER
jgi:hypothetical protein